MTCRICGGESLESVQIPEQHFGTGESFTYEICGSCRSMQIADIPADLSRYYPQGYYSIAGHWKAKLRHPIRRLVKRLRDGYELRGTGILGRVLARKSPYLEMSSLRPVQPRPSWRILDIGCGDGLLLWSLANLGFRNLSGVDPHIDCGRSWPGVTILKRELKEVEGPFDLAMFNHSLEHVAAPGESLRQAAALLAPGGLCLVRLPTPDSEAAKRYRQHWIQIDAPRHLHLISRTALRLLGEGAGLTYLKTWDDGNAFQLWGSEQALRGISLEDPRSMSRGGEVFSRAQMVAWEAEVKSLIRQNRSDSVAMLFQRSS